MIATIPVRPLGHAIPHSRSTLLGMADGPARPLILLTSPPRLRRKFATVRSPLETCAAPKRSTSVRPTLSGHEPIGQPLPAPQYGYDYPRSPERRLVKRLPIASNADTHAYNPEPGRSSAQVQEHMRPKHYSSVKDDGRARKRICSPSQPLPTRDRFGLSSAQLSMINGQSPSYTSAG